MRERKERLRRKQKNKKIRRAHRPFQAKQPCDSLRKKQQGKKKKDEGEEGISPAPDKTETFARKREERKMV